MPSASAVVNVGPGTVANHTHATVEVEIPPNTLIDSVIPEARNQNNGVPNYAQCAVGADCPIGWCAFIGQYEVREEPKRRVVSWKFENWSHDYGRDARVTVTYH